MSKWESLQLNKIAGLVMGQSPSSDSYNTEGEGMPFFQGKSDFGKVNPKIRMYCKSPKKLAHKNDILLSVRAPVGDVNIAEGTCCIGRGLAAISGQKEKSYSKYIYYYLLWKKKELENIGVGSTFKAIGKKDIEKILIPLPPLDIQKKIATALDTANALIEKRKEQIEKLDLLIKSQFIEMFGDPVTNPKGWETDVLGRLSDIYRGGSPRPISQFLGGNIPWIKIGDATKGDNIFLYETREKIIEDGVVKSRFVKDGSIIFANCGVSLGFARIIKFDGCIHDGWLSFENISPKLNKIFLLKSINMCTDFFREIAPDGTQPNLNTAIMKKYIQILPPSLLQNQFAEFVEKIEAQKVLLKKSLADMEQNYQSLMQKCFKGEIF